MIECLSQPRAAGGLLEDEMRECHAPGAAYPTPVLSALVGDDGHASRPTVGVQGMHQFGELEAVVMDRLWELGRPALVREVAGGLRPDRPPAYTTVMTVMENLYRKGWLRRERDGRAWQYTPTTSRSNYTAALMQEALDANPDRRTALAHFVLQLGPHDAALLQQALDQAHSRLETDRT
jgi:predicted transcriptional regulator